MVNFIKMLKSLREQFPDDSDAQDAIDVLKEKILRREDLQGQQRSEQQVKGTSMGNERTDWIPKEVGQNLKKGVPTLILASDGACRGNPGPGGWGALGLDAQGQTVFESSGFEFHTTNNIMELQGAIASFREAIDWIESQGRSFDLWFFSDSKYVVDGLTKWVKGWKARGWKKADKKPPENLALWQELDELAGRLPQTQIRWIKAHVGHPINERADELANMAIDSSL